MLEKDTADRRRADEHQTVALRAVSVTNCSAMTLCCEVQGQGQTQRRVPGHLHNDVTEIAQGSPNDVINTPYSTANSDSVAINSIGQYCCFFQLNNSYHRSTFAKKNVIVRRCVEFAFFLSHCVSWI